MNKKAFTLIELLVVMGIVGVLTALSLFNFNLSRVRARDVQRKSDMSQLQKALELYKNDHNQRFPTVVSFDLLMDSLVSGQYIKNDFGDPKYRQDGSWDQYMFISRGSGSGYLLVTCLENKGDTGQVSTEDDLCGVDCPCLKGGVKFITTNP